MPGVVLTTDFLSHGRVQAVVKCGRLFQEFGIKSCWSAGEGGPSAEYAGVGTPGAEAGAASIPFTQSAASAGLSVRSLQVEAALRRILDQARQALELVLLRRLRSRCCRILL